MNITSDLSPVTPIEVEPSEYPCAKQSRYYRGLVILFSAPDQGVVLSVDADSTLTLGGDYHLANKYPATCEKWEPYYGKVTLEFFK